MLTILHASMCSTLTIVDLLLATVAPDPPTRPEFRVLGRGVVAIVVLALVLGVLWTLWRRRRM